MTIAWALAALLTGQAAGPDAMPSSFSIAACDSKVAREPRSLDAWRCFVRVARRGREQARDARRRVESALAASPGNAAARFALASLEGDRSRDRAETLYREAIEGFERLADREGEVHARLGLGYFLQNRGRLDESERETDLAEEKAGDSAELSVWVTLSRAWGRYNRSDYAGAEALLKQVERAVFPGGIGPIKSAWLSAMGAALWGLGRYPEALAIYRRQAELLSGTGDRYDEAGARANVVLLAASTYGSNFTSEQRQEMLRLLHEARAAAIQGGNRGVEASVHGYLAQLLTDQAEQRWHAERAVALLAESPGRAYLDALRTLAVSLVHHPPRDTERGLRLLEEARSIAAEHGDLQGAARAALLKLNNLWSLSNMEGADPRWEAAAREAADPALDAIEAIRDRQSDAEVKARTFASWVFAYDQLAGYLLTASPGAPAPGDIAEAFEVMERRRAQVLLEDLDRSGAGAAMAAARPSPEAWSAVRSRINEILGRLRGGLDDHERTAALADLDRLVAEEADLRAAADAADPARGAWRGSIASLGEVESSLHQDEAMLSFQTADTASSKGQYLGGSWLLASTREGTSAHRLPDEKEIEIAVDLLVGLIQAGEPASEEAARKLFVDLLGPAMAALPEGIERLIVIPDGPLDRLPFAALRPDADPRPLGLRYRMSRAHSAATWLRLRQMRAGPPSSPLLALADPSLPAGDPRPALPFAHWEARAAARHLGPGGRVLSGTAANETALRNGTPGGFALVHLAAHALADPIEPSRSAVLLAPAGGEDGRLTMAEIASLGLGGRPVVLAACRGAAGLQLHGEGVMSLARAFLAGGASAVVGSLWEMDDQESARLLDRFYFHLGRGAGLDEALLLARRDRAAQGAPASIWSGVEIHGDAARAPLEAGRRAGLARWHVALLAGLTSAAAAARALRSRRRI